LAQQGLSAAREYAKIAPDSAHATHMPSHIFVRLGLWQDVIDSNLQSIKVAEGGAPPCHERGSELHAMHFLQFAYLVAPPGLGQDVAGRDGKICLVGVGRPVALRARKLGSDCEAR